LAPRLPFLKVKPKCFAPPFPKVDFAPLFLKVDFGSTFSKGGIYLQLKKEYKCFSIDNNRQMLNRKKRNVHLLNPYKIDAYNKFLATLDTNANIKKFDNINTIINDILKKTKRESDIILEESKKSIEESRKSIEETKKLIEEANKKFQNEYNKPIFTGKTEFDTLLLNVEIDDPNLYKDFLTKSGSPFKRVPTPKIYIQPKKRVTIDKDVQNLSDLLELIETYPLDSTIEYNVNMKALHNIKEHLQNLNNMIGMKSIKNNIVDQILYFIQNLHKNENGEGDFMHTVIYGSPGTGKTEVAKIMGKIFSKMDVLSKDKFLKVTRSDLIAGYLGQTALKTRDVIKDALGGVLFIDEAYALGNSEKRDSFSKECIDTLCEALSDHKDDLMVIIAGYEDELKDCFFDYNKGLDSRFTWRFKTDDYTGEDLYHIFIKKIKDNGWSLSEDSKITSNWFKDNIDYFKINDDEIKNMLKNNDLNLITIYKGRKYGKLVS
jgi:ATP-dependent 26S proteasome regulatory subunit